MLTSLDQIKENNIRIKEFNQVSQYANDLFYIKPLVGLLFRFLDLSKYSLLLLFSFLLIISKVILLKSLRLRPKEELLFEILFTCIPYFSNEVLTRNVVVVEFFLLSLYFHFLYQKHSIVLSGVLLGTLIYLNLGYTLLIILIFTKQ